jgi:hypothetical protein
MASPFRVFRKNVKPLLVIFGVMLIFVFLIGDYVGYLSGAGSGRGDGGREAGATAVSWDGGSLSNAEVDSLVVRRRVTNEFLQNVEGLGQQAALAAGIEPRPLRVQRLLGPELPQQGVEQDVVRTKLFADAARDAGMHMTDGAVVQYLVELGRGNVTRDEMRAILERMQSGGWRVSIQFVIDALREEMLARNYVASHRFAFDTVMPEQRWEDWLSVNDRVAIEAAAIPVDSFMGDVPQPTAAELETFFDEHRDVEPQPDPLVYRRYNVELPMSVPGFAIPRKIDVQYIEANFDVFLAKVENEITDAEIAKYYEDNKELFIKADTGLIDAPSQDEETPPADESQPPGAASEEAPPVEPSDTPEESTGTEAATETDNSDAPPVSTESEEVPEATPATEPADESAPDAEPAEGDQSSSDGAIPKSAFRLAAFLQEADATGAESESASDESATDSSTDAADAPNEEAAPADTAPADTATEGTEGASATESSVTDAASETPATTAPAEQKPKEYQPLEEVSDLIRREMAQRRVVDQMKDLMDQVAAEVKGEFDKYLNELFTARSREGGADPAPPPALADLKSLAEKHGLKYGKTGPMSALEMRETPVGKSTITDTSTVLLLSLFTTRDLELYQPVQTHDVNGNRYLMMKTSDTPGRVPKLAEVSDEVERAWKRQQAATKALKKAEEHAKNAQGDRQTLADYFAEKEPSVQVVRTDPFSKLTGGEVAVVQGDYRQQPFRLSQPDEIVAPGPEFLQRVFDLQEGEVGAVLNHDKSIAYVIRVIEHQDSLDELRTAYLAEANTWEGLGLKRYEHSQQAASNLVADVATNVTWERTPDQFADEETEPEADE